VGSPYLNTNESIILSTHKVVINTIPAEAILTSQRLILIDSRHTQLRPQDIPFTAIETVTIGENSDREPVLSISVVMHDGTRHPLGIAFPELPRTKRVGERDEWAVRLKEYALTAQHGHGVKPADLAPPWVPGELPPEEDAMPAAGEKFNNPPLLPRKARAGTPRKNTTLIVAGIVLVLIIALAAGLFILAPGILGGKTVPVTPAVTPVVTASTTPVPETTIPVTAEATQSPEPTAAVTAAATTTTPVGIPQDTGVWVKISYTGNFTGSFGTSGRMKDVTASGDQYYQVPAKDDIVDASIQKLDDSGNTLTVSVYSNGTLVSSGSVTKPRGTVEIHADLRAKTVTNQS
jgi:hypothetical protein